MKRADDERVRVRLDLAYDGTGFSGWAAQPGRRTVEGELGAGLARVLRAPVRLVVAGRTDAGVHAQGQVAHVDVDSVRWEALPGRSDLEPSVALTRRLAGVLDPDIVVRQGCVAPAGFDARFSAVWRQYCYRICDDLAVRDPATRTRTLWVSRPLDESAMAGAATALLGEHDFAAFCRPRPGATTVRDLQQLQVRRTGPGSVEIWVRADAFCHNMVRALVGTLLDVGWHRRDEGHPARVLASRSRQGAGSVVAAHGLTLEHVQYPDTAQLASRAAVARNLRPGAVVT